MSKNVYELVEEYLRRIIKQTSGSKDKLTGNRYDDISSIIKAEHDSIKGSDVVKNTTMDSYNTRLELEVANVLRSVFSMEVEEAKKKTEPSDISDAKELLDEVLKEPKNVYDTNLLINITEFLSEIRTREDYAMSLFEDTFKKDGIQSSADMKKYETFYNFVNHIANQNDGEKDFYKMYKWLFVMDNEEKAKMTNQTREEIKKDNQGKERTTGSAYKEVDGRVVRYKNENLDLKASGVTGMLLTSDELKQKIDEIVGKCETQINDTEMDGIDSKTMQEINSIVYMLNAKYMEKLAVLENVQKEIMDLIHAEALEMDKTMYFENDERIESFSKEREELEEKLNNYTKELNSYRNQMETFKSMTKYAILHRKIEKYNVSKVADSKTLKELREKCRQQVQDSSQKLKRTNLIHKEKSNIDIIAENAGEKVEQQIEEPNLDDLKTQGKEEIRNTLNEYLRGRLLESQTHSKEFSKHILKDYLSKIIVDDKEVDKYVSEECAECEKQAKDKNVVVNYAEMIKEIVEDYKEELQKNGIKKEIEYKPEEAREQVDEIEQFVNLKGFHPIKWLKNSIKMEKQYGTFNKKKLGNIKEYIDSNIQEDKVNKLYEDYNKINEIINIDNLEIYFQKINTLKENTMRLYFPTNYKNNNIIEDTLYAKKAIEDATTKEQIDEVVASYKINVASVEREEIIVVTENDRTQEDSNESAKVEGAQEVDNDDEFIDIELDDSEDSSYEYVEKTSSTIDDEIEEAKARLEMLEKKKEELATKVNVELGE